MPARDQCPHDGGADHTRPTQNENPQLSSSHMEERPLVAFQLSGRSLQLMSAVQQRRRFVPAKQA